MANFARGRLKKVTATLASIKKDKKNTLCANIVSIVKGILYKMKNSKNELMSMINRLIDGVWNVTEFRENYYDYFIEDTIEDNLTESELEFFGEIHEKLDWTDKNPSNEDRSYGWIDEKEYVVWVRDLIDKFELK